MILNGDKIVISGLRIVLLWTMEKFYKLFGLSINSNSDLQEANSALRSGVTTILATAPAGFIWATVTAVAMVTAGLPIGYVILINLLVYAASAQLTVLSMLVLQTPLLIIWLSAMLVNLRFVIFSAGLKPFFGHLNLPRRFIYGFMNGDMNAMLFNFRYRNTIPSKATNEQLAFFAGMGLLNYVIWQFGILIGSLLASIIPIPWGLELAGSLTLLALIIKGLEHWAGVVGCFIAAVCAVSFQILPFKLWVLVAIVLGILAALLVEKLFPNAYLKPKNILSKDKA